MANIDPNVSLSDIKKYVLGLCNGNTGLYSVINGIFDRYIKYSNGDLVYMFASCTSLVFKYVDDNGCGHTITHLLHNFLHLDWLELKKFNQYERDVFRMMDFNVGKEIDLCKNISINNVDMANLTNLIYV